MMMIKGRHTDCQRYACEKEQNQTSLKEFIARDSNWVLKAEIELLYPRRPLSTAVIAGYSQLWILKIQINLTILLIHI